MNSFSFDTTQKIVSEVGGISQLAEICKQLQITRPLIVTDGGIVSCGLLIPLESIMMEANLAFNLYDKVSQDPHESVINEGVTFALKHKCDGVIGFGGGSSMDSAKLIALLANNAGDISTKPLKLDDIYGVDQVTDDRLPLILIPTTAGTGSEVTPVSIITTGETTKAGVVATQLLPDVALLDAQLTIGLPAHITAATGIDAIVHAIEAYTSKIKKNPYSDMLAIQAIKLLSANIKIATFDGTNVKARQDMLLGACLAGQAFANAPVAAVHALAYPLGGHFHIPHGLSNSLVLPHVMRFNATECANLYATLAKASIDSLSDIEKSDEEVSETFIGYIETLIMDLQLPSSLAEMEIEQSQLSLLAEEAMKQTRLLINNPRAVNQHDAMNIYQQAFEGIK